MTAKVANLGMEAFGEEDVGRLKVSMQHRGLLRVKHIETFAQSYHHLTLLQP